MRRSRDWRHCRSGPGPEGNFTRLRLSISQTLAAMRMPASDPSRISMVRSPPRARSPCRARRRPPPDRRRCRKSAACPIARPLSPGVAPMKVQRPVRKGAPPGRLREAGDARRSEGRPWRWRADRLAGMSRTAAGAVGNGRRRRCRGCRTSPPMKPPPGSLWPRSRRKIENSSIRPTRKRLTVLKISEFIASPATAWRIGL